MFLQQLIEAEFVESKYSAHLQRYRTPIFGNNVGYIS